VTVESRPKVEALLRDANAHAPLRWRHINHPSSRGADVPMLYSAVQLGHEGRVMAVGRDLRAIAALQQRLVDAQQSMERDYWRLRHVETRYRLLFQMASEAVLIVDASSQKVIEANPAAGQLLGESGRRVVGRPFPEGFDADSTQAIQSLLAAVRGGGRADDVRVRSTEGKREFLVSASLFRQENSSLFLIRLSPLQANAVSAIVPKSSSRVLKVVESAPDGFVVTDPEGRILTANRAFIDLAQLATEEQARGESLDRWLGRPGVDLNVLIANLRQHGSVRLFATTLRGEQGSVADVEISAVSVRHGEQPCLGFTIRNVGRRLPANSRAGRELPRSVEQLTELVGRVPLKDLVREATDLIERLCIEAALELTHDNRASASEMLGLSRQSLYVKLRRYGLGDLTSESDS
jgi:transcriptional regulator PpsR